MFFNASMFLATKVQFRIGGKARVQVPTVDHISSTLTPAPHSVHPSHSPEGRAFSFPSSLLLDLLPDTLSSEGSLPVRQVIGSPITALPFDAQMAVIMAWAKKRLSKMVCVANAHMLAEAHWNTDFAAVLQKADIVTSDGMPIVWMMKLLGVRNQERVAGMDILMELCRLSAQQNLKVYFLGCQQFVLDRMKARLKIDFPNLAIAGMEPLPFRPMTIAEEDEVLDRIQASGAHLVFVSLGCPKQEKWMAQHQNRVDAVMLGLGGAFPVYGGIKKWAPRWVREAGLEWVYRLMQEPRRLAKRYGQTNQTFVWLCLKQLLQVGLNHRLKRR